MVPTIKTGQVYKSSEIVRDSYFKNKGLKDPSRVHFRHLSKLLDQGMLKIILSGFIMNNTLNFSKYEDS